MNPRYARWSAIAIVAATAAVWVATIGPAGGFEVGIGRYSVEAFVLNVVTSYLALLLCYVVWDCSSWKRRAARAILNLSAILLAVVLAETPAALGLLDYRAVLFPRLGGGDGPERLQRDPELVFRHRPGVRYEHFVPRQPGDAPAEQGTTFGQHGAHEKVEYVYDKNGFRNSTDLREAAVVCIGDSFVEGFMVPYERICAVRLGRILEVEVCNLGHDDYGPPQELLVLKRYALGLRPRVVVWFFFEGNDLMDLEDYELAQSGWRGYLTRGDGFAARCFCLNALERLDLWMADFRWRDSGFRQRRLARLLPEVRRDKVTLHFGGYFRWGLPDVSPRELALWEKARHYLREAASVCDQNQIKFLVVGIPTKFRVYRDLCTPMQKRDLARWELNDLPDRLSRWCRAAGVAHLDLTPALKSAARDGSLVYFTEDGHWSAPGQAVAAEQIAAFIRRAGWLPPDEPSSAPQSGPRATDR